MDGSVRVRVRVSAGSRLPRGYGLQGLGPPRAVRGRQQARRRRPHDPRGAELNYASCSEHISPTLICSCRFRWPLRKRDRRGEEGTPRNPVLTVALRPLSFRLSLSLLPQDSLRQTVRLEELVVGRNHVGTDDSRGHYQQGRGARALAGALRHTRSLRRLGLDGNTLGDAGARMLAVALRSNAALASLDVRSCGITGLGALELAEVLDREGCAIVELHLGGENSRGCCSEVPPWHRLFCTPAVVPSLPLTGLTLGAPSRLPLPSRCNAGNKLDQETIRDIMTSVRRPLEITFDDGGN